MDNGQRRGQGRRQAMSRQMIDAARDLRQRETNVEALLWQHLRNRRLNGLKFRRQHPFGPFVLDFCCLDRHVVVELDGAVHNEQAEQDEWRTQYICSFGYRLVRFRNEEILTNLPEVMSRLITTAELPLATPSDLEQSST